MSKVSFRARALDATKPMPVFRADEIPDLPDFATINRSVPQMPTGMEKEEETVRSHLRWGPLPSTILGLAAILDFSCTLHWIKIQPLFSLYLQDNYLTGIFGYQN